MLKRMVVSIFNIIFPPVAVCLLSGVGEDLLINCLLFLCAVIPSHIHGFYISMTYFNRKRKVRKGTYPGSWKGYIYSERVQNGGASNREVERLRREQKLKERGAVLEKVGTGVSGANSPTTAASIRSGRSGKRYSSHQTQAVPRQRSNRRTRSRSRPRQPA